ncbi:P-loop containing nucleoside triphosphate hydrolase protein [Obelidium mucronatum]|nr:P-loop containing nucleoside triphosphate hydrolase protein [Obelidium mucronatum]
MDAILDPAKVEAFSSYADHHELFDLFENMVKSVLVEMPQDPLQHMIDHLKQPTLPAIVICGPPRSCVNNLAQKVAAHLNTVHISVNALLVSAIERQTSLGQQARPFMEKGQLVPDQVIHNLVSQRLQEHDVITTGFVLEGYPATKDQAVAFQMKGVFLTSFVWIDCDDNAILDYNAGLVTDPIHKRDYHEVYSPPPNDSEILGRLVHREYNSRESVTKRLHYYRRHIPAVASCFHRAKICKRLKYMDAHGIWGREDQVFHDVINVLGGKRVTRAPRQFRLVIQGLPGSGKSSLAAEIEKKYGFVHVSPKKIILEEVSSKSRGAKALLDYIHCPDETPDDLITHLIIKRLQRSDCVNQGWVLEGYPNTKAQATALKDKGIVPNRLIWLKTTEETCRNRLSKRRQDPLTGRLANLTAPPQDISINLVESWPLHDPVADKEETVLDRIKKRSGLKKELESLYGYRKNVIPKLGTVPVESDGIMQEVDAEGLGEKDSKGRQPAFERVLELVDDILMKPIPVALDA